MTRSIVTFLDEELSSESYPDFKLLSGKPGPDWLLKGFGPCDACGEEETFQHVGTLGEDAVLWCKECGLYWTVWSDILIPGSAP